jgi:twinkle protein
MNLAEKLAEEGIRLRRYSEGSQKITCPRCSATRKHSRDPCLSVTIDDEGATWKCHNCPWEGGFRDRDDWRPMHRETPKPDVAKVQIHPLTPRAIEWFAARKISETTLRGAGVGVSIRWFPEDRSEIDCLAFPYHKPGGELVNAKFRTYDKQFVQVKDGAKIFWNIDALDFDLCQVVVTEGECDALALIEAGVDNAISVPDGAPKLVKDGEIDPADDKKFSYVWDCKADLDRFAKIVLAVDGDEPGMALAEELARRFGRERCWLVRWPEGCKDANDVLIKHGTEKLSQCIATATPHPVKNLFDVDQFQDQVIALYRGGRRRGVSTGWATVDEFITIRAGEMSIVTGIPGSGKSEWVDALMMNLAGQQGWRFAICSFENPPDEHLGKLAEKYAGAPFSDGPRMRMTETDLRRALAWLKDHFCFIRADDESPTIDWILEKAKAAVMRYGVKGLVIDPYNEIEHKRPAGVTETEYVSAILAKIKRFAQAHGVHVWFVAHPQKMQRDKDTGKIPVPTLYEISGSAHFVNKADIGIVVARDWADGSRDVEIHVKKVRFKAVGKTGVAKLEYDRPTGIYSDPQRASHWNNDR